MSALTTTRFRSRPKRSEPNSVALELLHRMADAPDFNPRPIPTERLAGQTNRQFQGGFMDPDERGAQRAMIFDAVGTLIHPHPSAPAIYAEVAQRHGCSMGEAEIADRFRRAYSIQESLDRQQHWQTSETRERDRWRQIVFQTVGPIDDREACFEELFERFAEPASWTLDPDAPAIFAQLLSQGVQIAIASNFDGRLHRVLDGLGQPAHKIPRILSSEVGYRKPSLQFFQAVVAKVGLAPSEILYVGDDWSNDYLGATAAGLRALYLDRLGSVPSITMPRIHRLREVLSGCRPRS